MDIKTAVQNLDNLIATSRMTRQEHIILQQSLEFLRVQAEGAKDERADDSVDV